MGERGANMEKFCLSKLSLSYRLFNLTTSNLDWVQIWFGSDGEFDKK